MYKFQIIIFYIFSELIRKANVNLAMFELIGKNDGPIGKNIRFLSNELKKLYADTDFANT